MWDASQIFRRGAVLLALSALMLAPRAAFAASNLHRELCVVAKEIVKVVKGMDDDAVSIGEFRAPPQLSASAGPAIAQSREGVIDVGDGEAGESADVTRAVLDLLVRRPTRHYT